MAGETVKLIADVRRLATEYTLGLQPERVEDEIIRPDHRRAHACWAHIAMLINNRLKPKQKQKIKKLAFELSNSTNEHNPNYGDKKDRHNKEPKYRTATNEYFGIKSQEYNKYIDWLIKKCGMGIADKDPDAGYW